MYARELDAYVSRAGRHAPGHVVSPFSFRPTMPPTVVITSRGEARVRDGHPWVYRSDVADVRADGGDVVLVRGPRGRPLGLAMFSGESQIAIRILARESLRASTSTPSSSGALIRHRLPAITGIDATAYR
jgi:23S rRNA (cytosine1962-C5)-methyltransferase